MSEELIKSVKIYKLAKELNLTSDTLIEYLTRKGHSIKNHMSTLDNDMLRDVLAHFKKDKETAERHNRKVTEFKETKKKSVEHKKEEVKVKVVEVKKEIEPVIIPEKKESEIIVETPKVEEVKKVIEPVITPKKKEPEVIVESPKVKEVKKEIEPVATKPVKIVEHLSALESAKRIRKFGLTIKGKIELVPEKPTPKISDKPTTPSISSKKKKKIILHKTKSDVVTDDKDKSPKLKKKKSSRSGSFSDVDVKEAIKRTLNESDENSLAVRSQIKKKKKKEREEEIAKDLEESKQDDKIIQVTEFVTVGELANLMKVTATEVISKCFGLGMMVSINQRLDKDNIVLVADEFGFEIRFQEEFTVDALQDIVDAEETLQPRPPIVTIMGHVDHGKTSLLDYIRQANVVAGESGGITQHIGAYEVTTDDNKKITFLDTPGHEAFTAMRARGAQLTDIVVLVVAAEDSVMPQTIEAINHAKAANVPIVIAINKIDKADANPERIKQQLSDHGVLIEEWGGKYQSVELSARTGKNVDLLLEKILLEADVLNLKSNPDRKAKCVVVEAKLDKGRGVTTTILVQKGTLKIGDSFMAGIYSGRVKAMYNERGGKVEFAGPSTPVQVLGFDGIPSAGDLLVVLDSEKTAREISLKRQQLKREQDFRQINFVTLEDISKQIKSGKSLRDLAILIKADTDGSVEALTGSLLKLSTDEVKIIIIHKGVGQITESDVLLAAASQAIIIGFHVRPNLNARKLAEKEKVEIRHYTIIYDTINDIKNALEGLLEPTQVEKVKATIEVRDIFKVPKVGVIAGCYILDGSVSRNNKVRLLREGEVLFNGTLSSLKRFKDDVKEVQQNYECGIGLNNYNDIKVGDIIEAYVIEEIKRVL